MSRYVNVNVEVDLDEFDTETLQDELRRRGCNDTIPKDAIDWLKTIHYKRRNGKDFTKELDQFISDVLGVVI